MDDRKPDPRKIAAEAVGERSEDAVPAAVKDQEGQAPQRAEEVARQPATRAGSTIAAKTAEAVGERASDAYSDAANAVGGTKDMSTAGRQTAQMVSDHFDKEPLMMVAAGFALGFVAGLMVHGRR